MLARGAEARQIIVAIAERWRYYSDGCADPMPFLPAFFDQMDFLGQLGLLPGAGASMYATPFERLVVAPSVALLAAQSTVGSEKHATLPGFLRSRRADSNRGPLHYE